MTLDKLKSDCDVYPLNLNDNLAIGFNWNLT